MFDFCQHCFKHFALWTFTSVAFKVKSLSAGFPHITLFNAAHFKGDSDDDGVGGGGNNDGDYNDDGDDDDNDIDDNKTKDDYCYLLPHINALCLKVDCL